MLIDTTGPRQHPSSQRPCFVCDATGRDILVCDPEFIVVKSAGALLLAPRRHIGRWRDLSSSEQATLAVQIGPVQEMLEREPGVVSVRLVEAGDHVHLHFAPPFEPAGPLPGLPHNRALISGGEDALHAHLRPLIDRAHSVDLSVSFLMTSGLRLILPHLHDLLRRGGKLRLLTGDYLSVTEPSALRLLLDLEGDVALHVFEAERLPFHPKAWMFSFPNDGGALIVGSSNLSRSALTDGIEWNLRHVDPLDPAPLVAARSAFEALLARPEVVALSAAWIDQYERRREIPTAEATGLPPESLEPTPTPHLVQSEALAALKATRAKGYRAGLVVLATGLGKTFLAAFDSKDATRVLFVAHREEILAQALSAFRSVRPTAKLGRYSGEARDIEADILFASVQTLARSTHLSRFERSAFDYIVVDEFHHAAAATYRRIIDHFSPRFLLGLTATPDRSDGGDLLGLCEDNLVYECDLWSGIDRGLLAPFHYYGVPDLVEYAQIPWRSGRFDETALTEAVATEARAQNALDQLARRGGSKAIGFCVSRRHADFMAAFAQRHDLRAVAVHSGETSAPRASALQALADGHLDIVFAVDMFNEGVDVPAIDTVLMLRPTESPVVWLQQLGRGLRRSAGKTHLAVIDYIGNHRSFLTKLQTLLRVAPSDGVGDGALKLALERFETRQIAFPEGCEVTYDLEALEILRALIRVPRDGEEFVAFYRDFRERHGARPKASEAEGAGFNPARTGHRGWLGFVSDMGDLTGDEQNAWRDHKALLEEIETTRMTRSYKMLVLRAMIEADAFPGRVAISDLMERIGRFARRNPLIREDLTDDPDDAVALRARFLQHPLRLLSETPWFQTTEDAFETTFSNQTSGALRALASELIDWRLLRYFKGRDGGLLDPGDPTPGLIRDTASSDQKSSLTLWDEYQRDQIPAYFGATFNTGAWNSGIVVLDDVRAMILLVTMDRRGMSLGGDYEGAFLSPTRLTWHTQPTTRRNDKRGRIISGAEGGWVIHLFLRKSKLRDGRAAPFRYAGPVRFAGWEGDAPITVQWDLQEALPVAIRPLFGLS